MEKNKTKIQKVAVFLSANDLEEKYTRPAAKLGALLAKAGFDLVFGGDDKGLMKVVADAVQQNGSRIIAVTAKKLEYKCKQNADEKIVAATIAERKQIMSEKADAFVVLVGGIGTLGEGMVVLGQKKHQVHDKPLIFLNIDNFYSGLQSQLQKMEKDGFLPKKISELADFVETAEEVIEKLV